jgi:hypothetical protein
MFPSDAGRLVTNTRLPRWERGNLPAATGAGELCATGLGAFGTVSEMTGKRSM